jgi:hypothetical protein
MKTHVVAAVEEMERRRLLDATLVDGTLVVLGTGISDDIRIYRAPGAKDAPTYVVEIGPVNGEGPTRMWQFPLDQVHSVLVRAGSGDDVVDLAVATFALPAMVGFGPVTVPSQINGGIGNDIVHGGMSRDFISDLFGNDQIFGHDGSDWINGGWGNDFIRGGNGNDVIFGGNGDDVIGGDAGNDRLYGGAGNDFLGSLGAGPAPTEPGDDLLVGGSGEDRLVGGEGKDRLYGGPGRDHFSRADDESEMLDRTPDEPIDIPLPV